MKEDILYFQAHETFTNCGICFLAGTSFAQSKTDRFLQELLVMNQDKIFTQVLQAPQTYRLQIIYTQINRDSKNNLHLKIIIIIMTRNYTSIQLQQ
jgi:hypothetical protein